MGKSSTNDKQKQGKQESSQKKSGPSEDASRSGSSKAGPQKQTLEGKKGPSDAKGKKDGRQPPSAPTESKKDQKDRLSRWHQPSSTLICQPSPQARKAAAEAQRRLEAEAMLVITSEESGGEYDDEYAEEAPAPAEAAAPAAPGPRDAPVNAPRPAWTGLA